MTYAAEAATSPVASPTPPDRAPMGLEEMLQQIDAIIWSDRKMDPHEMQLLRDFMETQAMKIQAFQQQAAVQGPTGEGAPAPVDDSTGEYMGDQGEPMYPEDQ